MKLTVGSLFTGIGGFDLGLSRAGFQIKWQVEIDEWCRKILSKHWPDVPKYGDIREVGAHSLEPVDLVCGGFPCQPFSNAGKRKGKDDDRYLWPEMLRVISELKPRWIIGENVAGLVNMELDSVLADVEGAGYETQSFIIPASAVCAPHRRDRLWILAHADSGGCVHRQPDKHATHDWKPSFGEFDGCREDISDAQGVGLQGLRAKRVKISDTHGSKRLSIRSSRHGSQWAVEPAVGRVANGLSDRVDRIKGLGNAVVPQIPEILGSMILEIEKQPNP